MEEIGVSVYQKDIYVDRTNNWKYVVTFDGIYRREEVDVKVTEEDGAFLIFDVSTTDGLVRVMRDADACLYLRAHPLVSAPVYIN